METEEQTGKKVRKMMFKSYYVVWKPVNAGL